MILRILFLLTLFIGTCHAQDYFENIVEDDTEATEFLLELEEDEDDYFQSGNDEVIDVAFNRLYVEQDETSEIKKWTHKSNVSKDGDTLKVVVDFARLRKSAKKDPLEPEYNAKRDDEFTYLGEEGSWYQIAIPDTFEYATAVTFQLGKVNAKSPVNIRKKARVEKTNSIIGGVKPNQKVQILKKVGNWYYVNTGEKTGYVYARYISKLNEFEENWNGGNITYDDTDPNPSTNTESSEASSSTHSSASKDLLDNVIRGANGGVEVNHVPAFAQMGTDPYDPKGGKGWRPQAYCGVTSFQMVMGYHGIEKPRDYYGLTNLRTGEKMVKSSTAKGQMYIKGVGSAYEPMVRMAKHLGYKNTKQVWKTSLSDMKARISEGRPQIVSVRGKVKHMAHTSRTGANDPGRSYYTNGHIIVVRGFTDNGNVIVNDPARGGKRRIIKASDFSKIWRGFTVDIKK
ncbi:MAG: C39 family peptidase [Candidatus Cloacimonetes bacterium]|nr:C39 family peptidase [Candidatus Cloacimonadota bacterium]